MALYRYVHKHRPHNQQTHPHVSKRRIRFPLTSFLLVSIGIFLIAWVMWPIVAFELVYSPKYAKIIRPIPDEVIVSALENQFSKILESTSIDYTKASNWFPKSPPKFEAAQRVTTYTLSIPKLRIRDAHVVVGGDDLDKSLIHYGGTALPGEYGNAVIFGHSVLPVFFNPTNYLTVFSTLPTLKEGDEIFVTADNVTYRYVVYEMRVVLPDDVSLLEQKYDWSYLSMVTCVPPGTYWKRLIVRAKLEKL